MTEIRACPVCGTTNHHDEGHVRIFTCGYMYCMEHDHGDDALCSSGMPTGAGLLILVGPVASPGFVGVEPEIEGEENWLEHRRRLN